MFIETAFGGSLLRRFERPDDTLTLPEMRIHDSIVMLGGAATDMQTSASHIHF